MAPLNPGLACLPRMALRLPVGTWAHVGAEGPDILEAHNRRDFERLLQWLRLGFLVTPGLALGAYGAAATPYAAMMIAAALCSYSLVWLVSRRCPDAILQFQLGLRLFDCALIYLVLHNYHYFIGNVYYDAVYLFAVVSAAVTHGRRGAVLVSVVAAALVLLSRLQLVSIGVLTFEARHITDSIFYGLLGFVIASSVAFLVQRTRQVSGRGEPTACTTSEQASYAPTPQDEALASLSHDLEHSLSCIKSVAQILHQRATDDPVRAQDALYLEVLESKTDTMRHLLGDLTEISHLCSGQKLSLQRREADLVELVERLVEQQGAMADGHQFSVQSNERSVIGYWDVARLERVISNLLSNATKYGPDEGRISIKVVREEDATGAWATLMVQDEGLGIPASDLPRVFDPFYRGGNVSGRILGTGMGLTSVRHIVEQHGGTVTVASHEGTGTIITVKLPLALQGETTPGRSLSWSDNSTWR
jgi:signal transduction histidine kinase